jgi:hypothetical protein
MMLGVGEATCNPAAYSIVADLFAASRRASALAVYHFGVYMGGCLGAWLPRADPRLHGGRAQRLHRVALDILHARRARRRGVPRAAVHGARPALLDASIAPRPVVLPHFFIHCSPSTLYPSIAHLFAPHCSELRCAIHLGQPPVPPSPRLASATRWRCCCATGRTCS